MTTENTIKLDITKPSSGSVDFLIPQLPSAAIEKKSEEHQLPITSTNIGKQEIELRYTEPNWARVPPASESDRFYIEVIKDGTLVETRRLYAEENRSYLSIGRCEHCDIKLEHPSVSRFHAILQYGECVRGNPQWYIYDLGSTHGVKINKVQIEKNKFVPLFAGCFFKIAGSTRAFVLCGGPKQNEHEEQELEQVLDRKNDNNASIQANESVDQDTADENKHCFYKNDPIHWLEKYFEREGVPMTFKFTKTIEDSSFNLMSTSKKSKKENFEANWICSIELVSDVSLTGGTMVSATAPVKKLAQLQCALLACERLDEACLLRISSLWNKRVTYAENDFYEDDEDTFYDRTGQIEEQIRKRKQRYEGDLEGNTKAKTYHDMLKELSQIDDKLAVIRTEIQRMAGKYDYDDSETAKNEGKSTANFSMRMAISQMRNKEKKTMEEKIKLEKLIVIAKPSYECEFAIPTNSKRTSQETEEKREKSIQKPTGGEENANDEIVNTAQIEEANSDQIETEKMNESSEISIASVSKEMNENEMEEQKQPEIEAKETKFYAPAMPSRAQAEVIQPKFGILTKQELIQMKFLQRQREKEKEYMGSSMKRARTKPPEDGEEFSEQVHFDDSEKYATWLPPTNQSGDGSTKLNEKFPTY